MGAERGGRVKRFAHRAAENVRGMVLGQKYFINVMMAERSAAIAACEGGGQLVQKEIKFRWLPSSRHAAELLGD